MMSVLVPIGDFSRMTHLSVKALRFYHDQGLLEPARIDPSSGYRFYDPGQVPVAQVIRRFRDLDMPLDQVRAVLTAPDVETRTKEIIAHLNAMETKLAELQMSVSSLRALLEGPAVRPEVEFRSIPATRALAVRGTVTGPGSLGLGHRCLRRDLRPDRAGRPDPGRPRRGAVPGRVLRAPPGRADRVRSGRRPRRRRRPGPARDHPGRGSRGDAALQDRRPTPTRPTARWARSWPNGPSASRARSASITWSRSPNPTCPGIAPRSAGRSSRPLDSPVRGGQRLGI